jgi:hypothetical protein
VLVVKQFEGGGGVEEPRLNSVSIRFCKRFAVDLDDPEGSDNWRRTDRQTRSASEGARKEGTYVRWGRLHLTFHSLFYSEALSAGEKMVRAPQWVGSGPRILSLFLGSNEVSLVGHENREVFRRAVGEFFLINPLNFDLRTFLRELLERCSNQHVGITMS